MNITAVFVKDTDFPDNPEVGFRWPIQDGEYTPHHIWNGEAWDFVPEVIYNNKNINKNYVFNDVDVVFNSFVKDVRIDSFNLLSGITSAEISIDGQVFTPIVTPHNIPKDSLVALKVVFEEGVNIGILNIKGLYL
jgi:hypothetical protein